MENWVKYEVKSLFLLKKRPSGYPIRGRHEAGKPVYVDLGS